MEAVFSEPRFAAPLSEPPRQPAPSATVTERKQSPRRDRRKSCRGIIALLPESYGCDFDTADASDVNGTRRQRQAGVCVAKAQKANAERVKNTALRFAD